VSDFYKVFAAKSRTFSVEKSTESTFHFEVFFTERAFLCTVSSEGSATRNLIYEEENK